jgi:hypothetical protein
MFRLHRKPLGLLSFCVVLAVSLAPAQKSVKSAPKEDTVRVATNVELVLPQKWYNEIWSAILKESYDVTVRTKDGKRSWKGTFDRVVGYKDPRSGSTTYLYRIRQTFKEPGEYVIEKVFSGRGEEGPPVVKKQSWNIIVKYPTLAGPLSRDTYYFPGEKPVISFATLEFPEATGYRYEILQGDKVVKSGSGSNVFLDSLVNDTRSVGKEFDVRGYYKDSTFSFLAAGDSTVHESKWHFKVRMPILDMANLWCSDDTTKQENLPQLPMGLNADYNPRLFSFTYLGSKGKALILSQVLIRNPKVEAIPADFLAGSSLPVQGKVWTDITITPNEEFLKRGRRNQLKYVEIIFTFETQFEQITRRFRAYVY